jgi:hypothetical protein
MPTIAVLPLDDRPVTYDLPARIGAIGGATVLLPDRALLGNLTQSADQKALGEWLTTVAAEADALVLAIDTLAYGGLIPSRRSPDDLETIMAHLQPLLRLKERKPDFPIYAFSVTMRLSNSDVNEEEKPYWDQYGKLIYKWSFHQHRYKTHKERADWEIAHNTHALIPAEILDDYRDTRQRNFTINQTMLRWAGGGFFRALMLTQDDTSSYGLNIEEQEELKQMINHSHLGEVAFIYPGADEVASVLVSRALNELAGRIPTMAGSWHPLDGKRIQAMYEDRPLWQTLRGQIKAAGGKEIGDEAQADVVLVVNTPASGQGDLTLRLDLDKPDTPMRNLEPLLLTLEGATRPVAFADVAYANGCDPRLMPELVKRVDPWKLKGFGGWNTAGNTFGSVVAAAFAATLPTADQAALDRFITERVAEDWLYQSVIRRELQDAQAGGASLETLKGLLDQRLAALWAEYFPGRPATFRTYFPWNRLFEAAIFVD